MPILVAMKRKGLAVMLSAIAAIACTSEPRLDTAVPHATGIRGDLVYVGGPYPGVSHHREPGRVTVFNSSGNEVDSETWGESGRFLIILPAGTYRLVSESGDARCPDKEVEVEPNSISVIHLTCEVM
jgi:hypothetical protein